MTLRVTVTGAVALTLVSKPSISTISLIFDAKSCCVVDVHPNCSIAQITCRFSEHIQPGAAIAVLPETKTNSLELGFGAVYAGDGL